MKSEHPVESLWSERFFCTFFKRATLAHCALDPHSASGYNSLTRSEAHMKINTCTIKFFIQDLYLSTKHSPTHLIERKYQQYLFACFLSTKPGDMHFFFFKCVCSNKEGINGVGTAFMNRGWGHRSACSKGDSQDPELNWIEMKRMAITVKCIKEKWSTINSKVQTK